MKRWFSLLTGIIFTVILFVGCDDITDTPRQVENQEITVKFVDYNEDGSTKDLDVLGNYTGTFVNGVPHGEGIFSSINDNDISWTYTGSFLNGQPNGFGSIEWDCADEDYVEEGTYTDGLYTPTTAEMISSYGKCSGSYGQFDVSDESKNFIDQNNDAFPAADQSIAENLVTENTELRKLKKTTEGHDNSLIKLRNMYVLQISDENYGGVPLTKMLLADDHANYVAVYYLGEIDYYEQDIINIIYVLPLDNTGFDNISGGTTLCLAAFGSYIS